MSLKSRIAEIINEKFPLSSKIYREYKLSDLEFHKNNKFKSWKYLAKLILSKQDEKILRSISTPNSIKMNPKKPYVIESTVNNRPGIDQSLMKNLQDNDVISFDIFDTAILRNLENPRDVFLILSSEMGIPNFKSIRNYAETLARNKMYSERNTREVTLDDIYEVLHNHFNIDYKWKERELEIEYDLSSRNDYIYEIYQRALQLNKKIIFVTDMYLSKSFIAKLLKKCGYNKFNALFVSNDMKMSKEDCLLWNYITKEYAKGKKIFHIGDNYNNDIKNAKMFNISTYYYRSVRELAKPFKEDFIDNLGGSFYRGIINNNLHNGIWKHNMLFEHGFKIGGILYYGYCEFINKKAKELNCDLILFCSRDCDFLHKIYKSYFNQIDSEYILVSRFALINISLERNYDELLSRIFNNNLNVKQRKTIRELFNLANLNWLIDEFSRAGFNPDTQISMSNIEQVKMFLYDHQDEVIQNREIQKQSAIQYFTKIIGEHKNILVVDVGWSGSSYSILKYFINKNINQDIHIVGSLLIGNNNDTISTMNMNNTMHCYLIAPDKNFDLLKRQFKSNARETHINNQIFEYLFTSCSDSLISYDLDSNNKETFRFKSETHNETKDLADIQSGILEFVNQFYTITNKYSNYFEISPYVASGAYYKNLDNLSYNSLIYKNFIYDAQMGFSNSKSITFYNFLHPKKIVKNSNAKNILLISHSFSISGAPRSLLRIGKVLIKAGYNVEVWCPFDGGIREEFETQNISTMIVKPECLNNKNYVKLIKKFDMAICNTILTFNFYSKLKSYIPTVWYIREATNIPDYCTETKNVLMYKELCNAPELICVSDYAKKAIMPYNKNVEVLKNCVEDVSEYALPYSPAKNGIIKFVQLGSLEERKGFHLILNAIDALPEEYKNRCEFYFAGQVVKSSQKYADKILDRISKMNNVKYLGVISDEKEKIEFLSQMDVVIVASLDESCSLVALEGTMLSKPLIVTENVGAKYVVDNEKNGLIIKTNDDISIKDAIIYFIHNQDRLLEMGNYSRSVYCERSDMNVYYNDIVTLVERYLKTPQKFILRNKSNMLKIFKTANLDEKLNILKSLKESKSNLYNSLKRKYESTYEKTLKSYQQGLKRNEKVIVSLTSYPPRMNKITICIKSLLNQYFKPDQVILWLAKEQYPNLENDLPKALLRLKSKGLTISWCDDLKPHKKYYYTMKQNPDAVVITVDDDMNYPKNLIGKIYDSYLKNPHAVSCLRAHLIKFNSNGSLKKYKDWGFEDNTFVGKPTYRLLPTGVMGILYPPRALPKDAFNKKAIKDNCLMTDDIWLKFMCTANGYPTVLVEEQGPIKCIDGTQESAISNFNVGIGNDTNINLTLRYCDKIFGKDLVKNRLIGLEDDKI